VAMLIFEERYYVILLGFFIPKTFKKYFEKARGGKCPSLPHPSGRLWVWSSKLQPF